MGATLSDEERRLLILQAAYDQDLQGFTFLRATGVIRNVVCRTGIGGYFRDAKMTMM
jgi:hypothetical protein